jgi:hypothetical protein
LRGDEAVDLAKEKRVLGLQQLDPGDLGPTTSRAGGRRGVPGGGGGGLVICRNTEYDEGNVVSRVVPHDLGGGGGPVEAVDLPAWVLEDDRRRLRRLAVAHRSRPPAPLSPAAAAALVVGWALGWWFREPPRWRFESLGGRERRGRRW